MITITESTLADIPLLTEWISRDPYHFHLGQPHWWLSQAEGSLLAFRLDDDKGPLTFVRLNAEGEHVRIHTQFAPEDVVSKRRLVVGMVYAIKSLIVLFQDKSKGLIFDSVSPTLIAFMGKNFGFKHVGGNDHRLDFEGN